MTLYTNSCLGNAVAHSTRMQIPWVFVRVTWSAIWYSSSASIIGSPCANKPRLRDPDTWSSVAIDGAGTAPVAVPHWCIGGLARALPHWYLGGAFGCTPPHPLSWVGWRGWSGPGFGFGSAPPTVAFVGGRGSLPTTGVGSLMRLLWWRVDHQILFVLGFLCASVVAQLASGVC